VIGEALGQLAESDDIETTMIGQGQDWELARELAVANSHVTWVDWMGPDELPTLVAAHDVCLGIFGTGPKALRVVPNKVFQGAAAGCAIVTSDTAPQRRLLGDAAVFVPPGDAKSLADILRQLSVDRQMVSELRLGARGHSSTEFTASAVIAPLRQRLTLDSQVGLEARRPD
jgi:glycosyltransferase involved in cell wall biosynthesis